MAKNKILKPILIGSAIAGAGFLTYQFIIKPLIDSGSNENEDITPPESQMQIPAPAITQTVQQVTSVPSGTTKFDPAKVLRPGSKTSLELQYCKRAFNSLIELSRKVLPTFVVKSQDDFNFKKRLETISKLTLLDVNTEYGAGTKTVAQTILGSTDFTYNRVKSQKIAFYKRLGLPNPY